MLGQGVILGEKSLSWWEWSRPSMPVERMASGTKTATHWWEQEWVKVQVMVEGSLMAWCWKCVMFFFCCHQKGTASLFWVGGCMERVGLSQDREGEGTGGDGPKRVIEMVDLGIDSEWMTKGKDRRISRDDGLTEWTCTDGDSLRTMCLKPKIQC